MHNLCTSGPFNLDYSLITTTTLGGGLLVIFERRNTDVWQKKGKIPLWIIAEKLNIHENTLRSWLRQPLSIERKNMICSVIDKIKTTSLSKKQENLKCGNGD